MFVYYLRVSTGALPGQPRSTRPTRALPSALSIFVLLYHCFKASIIPCSARQEGRTKDRNKEKRNAAFSSRLLFFFAVCCNSTYRIPALVSVLIRLFSWLLCIRKTIVAVAHFLGDVVDYEVLGFGSGTTQTCKTRINIQHAVHTIQNY